MKARGFLRLASLVCCMSLMAAVVAAGPGAAAHPRTNGKIAFVRGDRGSNTDIYVMNADGTSQVRLTHAAVDEYDPAWSPSGTQIAFVRSRNNQADIFVMNADGSGLRRLTHNRYNDYHPVWSPDGSKIAFQTDRNGGPGPRDFNVELYVMTADGRNETRLTNDANSDRDMQWSPDGSKLAFESNGGGFQVFSDEIWVINADGTGATHLTPGGRPDPSSGPEPSDANPSWSPDGGKIAFETERISSSGDIFAMNPDGTNPTNLTADTAGPAGLPLWSPDGSKIAFIGNGINVMNPDGSGKTLITSRSFGEDQGVWSPAGSHLAFEDEGEIYVVAADGSRLSRLTVNGVHDADLDWGRDPAGATPPVTSILSAPAKRTFDRTPEFSFTANETGSSFECKLDGLPFEACASPKGYRRIIFGRHVFKVRARDASGFVDPTPAKYSWRVMRPPRPCRASSC